MKWLDNLIAWLFPNILVEGTPWRAMWLEKERASFISVIRPFLLLVAIIYMAHHYFYDIPNHLEPESQWLLFRIAMTALALIGLIIYSSPFGQLRIYRLPAITICWAICISQAYVALYHGRESWIFCYILINVCVLVLRMSALRSAIFSLICIGCQVPILREAGIPISYIFTGSIIAVGISLVARASYVFEVRSFLLDQENMEGQKRLIELNLEFSERIRSFIPKVIAERIDRSMDHGRMNVIEASIEVLVPQHRRIACLFSDIRGFTKSSSDMDGFLKNSVIPEVKACTQAVEGYDGIPRKIGDLIFAYFDDQDISKNILRSAGAAVAVSRVNRAMNATANARAIRRYVLLSCGDALVGNLGGIDSSVEITALGDPVNFLSRLDEATKHPSMVGLLEPGDLVLSEQFSSAIRNYVPDLEMRRIDLQGIGVALRDFADVRSIYILPPTDANYESILRALDADQPPGHDFENPRIVAA